MRTSPVPFPHPHFVHQLCKRTQAFLLLTQRRERMSLFRNQMMPYEHLKLLIHLRAALTNIITILVVVLWNVEANAFYRIVGDSSTRCIDQADDELVQAEDIHLSDERSFGDPSSPVLPPSSPPTSQISACNLFNSAPVLAQEDEREASQSADLPELQEGLTREKMNLSDALPPSSPVLFSSQPRASSPDRIFDSSPPDWARVSPLTSPQLFPAIDDKEDTLESSFSLDTDSISDDHGAAGSIVLGKRKVEDEETESSMDQKRAKLEEGITLPPPPNPKRPTQASQKKQYRKLVKPFRSPLVNIEDVLAGKDAVYASGHARSRTPDVHSAKGGASSISKSPLKEEQLGTTHLTAVTANKDRTAKVAKPFRAPSSMSLPASISVTAHTTSFSSSSSASGVHAAPTIQTLQARVQKLKQAIKIKEDRVQGGDDDKLEVLAGKWKSVGREVAWLVWDTVRDLEPGKTVGMLPAKGGWDEGENPFGGGGNGRVKRVGGGEGWGYDGGKGGGGSGWGISSGWGWDEKGEQGEGEEGAEGMEVEEDEQEVPEHTLGTMLRHMGIDPETLGWDEDEGDFVGDA
ncbi:hypothetical protein BDY19DRAFT_583022 [Irpex rosettiformis]|uniref:Uncharacterized protein n=1 Tax=Irpex rosettiformis TaxID=378272 RepID=A0ACB8UCW2_9APHY|nr:hypothetical protein BDY19DRAFT_583022 [Irpex rosettiformis]